MDISAALVELLESIASRDMDSAEEKLEEISGWIAKGGFIPESIHKAMDCIRFAD